MARNRRSSILDDFEFDDDLTADELADEDRRSRRARSAQKTTGPREKVARPPRNERDQAFKCGHCKQFIGVPVTGGRHRNHCPNCLYSKHVDLTYPGDRKATCKSLMKPVALVHRRSGEQVILHECLGCGATDPNRIAADDNPVALQGIPIRNPADDEGEETLLDDVLRDDFEVDGSNDDG